MFPTDQATAASSLPTPAAAGTSGYFTNGNPVTGVAATIVDADWLNMIQQELLNIVAAGGLTPSKTTYNQVLAAIKRVIQNTTILADTGTANAYSAVNAVPLVSGATPTWIDGVVQAVKIAHANTGASTYAPDGLTAIPIYGLGLQPLQGSELVVGGTAILMRTTISSVNSGNPICILMECAGGAQQVPPATASQHAMQLGQATGRLLNVQVITSSGTYTPTAGTNSIIVEVQGAGGGSGGTTAQSSGSGALSVAASGGSYAKVRISNPGSQTVTVGAPGAAGTSTTSGGAGGASSFGSAVSCPGGLGGGNGSGSTGMSVVIGAFSPAAPTVSAGTTIESARGTQGLTGVCMAAGGQGVAGPGGGSKFGSGGSGGTSGSGNVANTPAYGAGAGASYGPSGWAATAGAAGGSGIVIVHEYA